MSGDASGDAGAYRYSPAGPHGPHGLCDQHPGCIVVRCARFLCPRPVHRLNQRGRPRRFCSAACRVAEHRRLHG